MKAGWSLVKLSQVCELINGRAYNKDELLALGKYKVLRVGNFFTSNRWYFSDLELEDKKYCDFGDLLYAWSASFGPRIWQGEKVIFHYHIWKVLPNFELITQKFLYHFFNWDMEKIKEDQGAGTTMLHVSKGSMDNRDIALPSIAEQQRIVAILDEAFERIAIARTNTEKNLQNARALFESHLQNVFFQRGEGWVVKGLSEVLQKTETVDPSKKPDIEFTYLDVSSVNKDTKEIEEVSVILGKDAPSRARKLIRTNDVIFATIRPTHGRVALIPEEYNEQVCSTGYFVFRAKEFLNNKLVLYFLLTPSFNNQMEKLQKGASYPAVTDTEVKGVMINFPKSLAEQKAIVTKFDSLREKTQHLESLYKRKLTALDALKKSLLHQAFAGELTSDLHQTRVISFKSSQPKPMSSTDLHAGILVLAYQKHEEKGNVINFGHVKAEKIAHMLEAKLDIDLGRAPIKAAAGPNDYPHLKMVESRARKAGYFDFKQVDGAAYRVNKLPKFDDLANKTRAFLAEKMAEIDGLMELMLPMDTQQAEIFCTVYAAWNNLLLDGQQPTDENIVFEARENWHSDKLKIPRERFFAAISWMQNKQITPEGKGKKVLAKTDK